MRPGSRSHGHSMDHRTDPRDIRGPKDMHHPRYPDNFRPHGRAEDHGSSGPPPGLNVDHRGPTDPRDPRNRQASGFRQFPPAGESSNPGVNKPGFSSSMPTPGPSNDFDRDQDHRKSSAQGR